MAPSNRPNGGFTLVELMVTLAVMAVVLVAAAPSMADFFDKNRVRGAADAVVTLLSNARTEAVKSDLDVNVSFTGSGAAWCVGANAAAAPTGGNLAQPAASCNCSNVAQCFVGGARSVVDSSAYSNVSVGALPTAMVFDSKLGTISPLGSRQVTLTSPAGKYDLRVEVNALGQARLCVPASKPAIAGVASC